jgi:hypothetical protein
MASKFKRWTPVYVEWLDTSGEKGWCLSDAIEPMFVRQLGFFLRETKDAVVICSGFAKDEQLMDPCSIPRGVLVTMRKVVL